MIVRRASGMGDWDATATVTAIMPRAVDAALMGRRVDMLPSSLRAAMLSPSLARGAVEMQGRADGAGASAIALGPQRDAPSGGGGGLPYGYIAAGIGVAAVAGFLALRFLR